MKHLKLFEVLLKSTSTDEYIWLDSWIKNKFGNYVLSGSLEIEKNRVKITIFHDADTWVGMNGNKIEEITNFYKYLIDNKIISSEEQFRLKSQGQFKIVIEIDDDEFKNNEELLMYKNAKKYNL